MNRHPIPQLIAAALSLAAISGAHAADRRNDHETARAALARGEILPLVRILAIAGERAPGDVLKVELEDDHPRPIYEVKVLGRDGRVREVEIDARTGAVIKVEDD